MPEIAYEKEDHINRKYVLNKKSLAAEFNEEGNQIFLKGTGTVILFRTEKEFHSEPFENEYITLKSS